MRYDAALVTGASSGIGEALAKQLPPGTDLLLTGRNAAQLEKLSIGLASPGRRVEFIPLDLTIPAHVGQLIAKAKDFGIDLLIANAGIGSLGSVLSHTTGQEEEMVALNISAPLRLSRELLPGMIDIAQKKNRRAGLILLGSVVAMAPFPYLATYAATKSFNVSLARCLAVELAAAPVDILALCPGGTRTRFSERAGAQPTPSIFSHDADRVARDGLTALGRRTVLVVGLRNRMFTTILSLMPAALAASIIGYGVQKRLTPKPS